MTDKILNGNDYAQARGFPNVREMLRQASYKGFDTPYQDAQPSGAPVFAFVSFGFWIAMCECNGAEYVAPGEPFYCMSCGNFKTQGQPRPVIFPDNKNDIEAELLKRPVTQGTGRNSWERAQRQRAAINTDFGFLSRTWLVTETLNDLKTQNAAVMPKKKGRR